MVSGERSILGRCVHKKIHLIGALAQTTGSSPVAEAPRDTLWNARDRGIGPSEPFTDAPEGDKMDAYKRLRGNPGN